MTRLTVPLPRCLLTAFLLAFATFHATAGPIEPPIFAQDVASGRLPPMADRLPQQPAVADFAARGLALGQYGGELRTLVSTPKDTRLMVVFGYARLVGYDADWHLRPDILESIDVRDGRVFTLKLRKGHRWSDGEPFTSEDFRFFWEDIANNPELSPGGLDRFLLADGKGPTVTFPDETTIVYAWEHPNPFFLPALAGSRPEYIYAPAHTLKRFHPRYRDPAELAARAEKAGQRNWVGVFIKKNQQYRSDDPSLPTLEPWRLVTKPPSSRFVFERNPYYHRVDPEGRQLPYIDQVALTVVSATLIPAKAAAGDADLQARGLGFDNYTVLKQGAARNPINVRLWRTAKGSELALYPNLNATDATWQTLLRDVRFRRALSLAINRHEVNQVIYYGLAQEGDNTVLPASPLYRADFDRWARFDLQEANKLLDSIGLTRRDGSGIRLLPDGRRLELVAETAGEEPTQIAILQLIADTWREVGIHLLPRGEQREVMRNRVFAGSTLISVWTGLENALATATTSPAELAPTSQQQLCWPKWGQYYESSGQVGSPPDDPHALDLLNLYLRWTKTSDIKEQTEIWERMLDIRADQSFSIGTVREVPQPVVVSNRLQNVPQKGIYNWEPGAFFGVYRPDTFWFTESPDGKEP